MASYALLSQRRSVVVAPSGVLFLDLGDLRSELRHGDLVLLLLDAKGDEHNLKHQREQEQRDRIGVGEAVKCGQNCTEQFINSPIKINYL